MDHARISVLLQSFMENLTAAQIDQISTYIDILLRWNAKMNLTAIRDPEQIVTRHFGESLFLARQLSEVGIFPSADEERARPFRVIDVGSGAGFPGIPLKIACSGITLELSEAQQRKAVFLKEVLRALNLDAAVKNVRAEILVQANPAPADLVTLRAVEKFESVLPIASQLVTSGGVVALLIGREQADRVKNLLENWQFRPLVPIPGSQNRVIMLGTKMVNI